MSTRSTDQYEIAEVDLSVGRRERQELLSRTVTELASSNKLMIPQWRASPDRRRVGIIDLRERESTVTIIDIQLQAILSRYLIQEIPHVSDFAWSADSDQWLVWGVSNRTTVLGFHKGSEDFRVWPLPAKGEVAICITPEFHLLALDFGMIGDRELNACEFRMGSTLELNRKWRIRLPIHCECYGAAFSPSANRILWRLKRIPRLPMIDRTSSFPFFAVRTRLGSQPEQLWISKLDGTGFAYLGYIPTAEGSGDVMNWMPDERAISVVMRNTLFAIPILAPFDD